MQIEVTLGEAILLRHLLEAACRARLNESHRGQLDMRNMQTEPWTLKKKVVAMIQKENPNPFTL